MTAMASSFQIETGLMMEQVPATRSVSITELTRNPPAVLEQAGAEPVLMLKYPTGRPLITKHILDAPPAGR